MDSGRHLAVEFQRDSTPPESPAVLAYVNGIGQRQAAQIAGAPFTYTVALTLDDPSSTHTPSALPGGYLCVPAALIPAAKDEGAAADRRSRARRKIAPRPRAACEKLPAWHLEYHSKSRC